VGRPGVTEFSRSTLLLTDTRCDGHCYSFLEYSLQLFRENGLHMEVNKFTSQDAGNGQAGRAIKSKLINSVTNLDIKSDHASGRYSTATGIGIPKGEAGNPEQLPVLGQQSL
jgi:hypothetical protein